MASNVVRATLLSDASRFKAGFKDAENATESFSKKAMLVGGVVAAALAVKALSAVKQFVGDSIRAYSDLEQASGAVESVFGDLGAKISRFAKGAAQDVGLSESAFKALAANIGGQLQNMGFSVDEAADKTIELISVGADLAATYGGTVTDAVKAISSLLRGERDPIEKYAIGIKDADVQARNLADGLDTSTPAAKRQSDAISALAILMEQSGPAQGQFAREQDTIAGKTERANAQIENNKALVGQALSQAYSTAIPLTTMFSDLMAGLAISFMESTGAMNEGEAALARYTATTGGAVETIAELLPLIEEQIEKEQRLARQRAANEGGDVAFVDGLQITADRLDEMLTNLELNHEELVSWNEDFKRSPEYINLSAEELAAMNGVIRQHTIAAKVNEDQLAENKLRMEALTGATEGAEEAQEELNIDIKTGTELMSEAYDQMRTTTDALFAVREATDKQAEAQKAVNDLVAAGNTDTPEYIQAVEDLATANMDVRAAQIKLIEQGGLTRAEFVNQQTALGLTREQAERLADTYDDIFTPRTVTHTINYNERRTSQNPGRQPGAQHGGRIFGPTFVGEAGPEIFVPDQPGTVIPNHRLGSGPSENGHSEGGTVINLTIHAGLGTDPNALGKALVEALQRYQRQNGALPFKVRG